MARAVRISRRPAGAPAPRGAGGADVGYRANTGGLTRSGRLFGLFLVLLGGSYGIFVGLLRSSAVANGSEFGRTVAYLSLLAAAVALYGFAITLGRTPRGVERGGGRLVVVEFLGTRRIFPMDGSLKPIVENRYGVSALAPAPTEMVALKSARGPLRHYLVESGLLPESVR